jgi:hypothetical protein
LYGNYHKIGKSETDDGVIDKSEFKEALGLKSSEFVNRMFNMFDGDGNGEIDFSEFVIGLSVFSTKGTESEKINCKKKTKLNSSFFSLVRRRQRRLHFKEGND